MRLHALALALAFAAPAMAQEPSPPAGPAETQAASPSGASPPAEGAKAQVVAPPLRLAGQATELTRQMKVGEPKGIRAQVNVDLEGRARASSSYALDAAGTPSSKAVALSPQDRLGLVLKGAVDWPVALTAEYEQDLPTGTVSTGPLPAGLGMPGDVPFYFPLRKADLTLAYKNLLVTGAGVMLENWGLGLVANDGAHGWEPGSARFVDPRGGDRVLRGFVGTGPYSRYGLVAMLAVEQVLEDDALLSASQVLPPATGDSAQQILGILSLGRPEENWGGIYAVYRNQTASDGRWLHATVLDLSATTHRPLSPSKSLFAGAETAYIMGATSLTGSPTYAVQGLRQFGAAVRTALDMGRYGAALDGLYASGDANPDDAYQTGFRANHNYDCGFILFQQVLAAQTARGAYNLANPQLVGTPPTGIERYPTWGSATNAIAVFPRLFVRPFQGVEVYGGPLLAWAAQPPIDLYNTAIAGGSPRNALNGTAGDYLGTELDAGVRIRFLLWGTEPALGVEGGVLLPGSAFQSATGMLPTPISSARLILGFKA